MVSECAHAGLPVGISLRISASGSCLPESPAVNPAVNTIMSALPFPEAAAALPDERQNQRDPPEYPWVIKEIRDVNQHPWTPN
jgi:hypothetical protein